MAGTFIDIQVDTKISGDRDLVAKLVEVCPVDIFAAEGGALRLVEDNMDECVLCDLCLEVGPKGGVRVIKLYE